MFTGLYGFAVNFTTPLVVKLVNGSGQPIAGETITFNCPAAATWNNKLACSLNFRQGSATAVTNSAGLASLGSSSVSVGLNMGTDNQRQMNRDDSFGPIVITANYKTLSVPFHVTILTLAPPTPAPPPTPRPAATPTLSPGSVLSVVSGDNQSKMFTGLYGFAVNFTTPLVVKLVNGSGQPIAGETITFTCPAAATWNNKLACSLNFSQGTATAVTNSSGLASLGSSGVSVGLNMGTDNQSQMNPRSNSFGPILITATYKTLSVPFHVTILTQ